ncbi:MAG: hypothetical protein WKF47_04335 [Geodermatophilaceae bacterium]
MSSTEPSRRCTHLPSTCDAVSEGHGTENDFILLPDSASLDPAAEVPTLSAMQVRRLCDRHAGIGADGVLRVLPVGAATEAESLATGVARWFMDYRNADGSVSEMCGNGARLFARYLLDAGLESGARVRTGNARRGAPDQSVARWRGVCGHGTGNAGDGSRWLGSPERTFPDGRSR